MLGIKNFQNNLINIRNLRDNHSSSVDITGEQSDFIYENLEDASDTDNKGFTVEQTFEEDPNYAGTYSPVDKHEEQETVERVGYPDNIELVGFDKYENN